MGIKDWREGEAGGQVRHRATDSEAKVGRILFRFPEGAWADKATAGRVKIDAHTSTSGSDSG